MIKVISTEKLPIKLWLERLEDGAMEQARHLANLPFTFKHVAIMPDSHQGYGMPIGGVLATRDVIIPNAVGVDIGCGMCALQTNLKEIDRPLLKNIVGRIHQLIPVGFDWHKQQQPDVLMPDRKKYGELPIIQTHYKKARQQLGTLGGGNHFIEIQQGGDGNIWVMVHSGSRNLGKQVADHYNKLAIQLNQKRKSDIPKAWQLAFLPLDCNEACLYQDEMNYCVEFALANRKRMIEAIQSVIEDFFPGVDFQPIINIAHNFASYEKHFNQNVMVHRKGATQAGDGQMGIIPGSQGANSYIIRGKGNPESFQSCSHGAGRKLGRKQAIRELNLQKEQHLLEQQGIIHALKGKNSLDEAPGAYKDIAEVMENQQDLVDIVVELKPLAVIKG